MTRRRRHLRLVRDELDAWGPVAVPRDAPFGEDVSMSALSKLQYEYLAAFGPLAPGEEIPSDDEIRRRLEVDFAGRPAYSRAEVIAMTLPERWYRAILEQEQAEADCFHALRAADVRKAPGRNLRDG